jgi:hypothetical protein
VTLRPSLNFPDRCATSPYRARNENRGRKLRERFKLPQDIPDKLRKLLTVITQIDGEGKPSSSVDFLLAYRLSCKNRQADATPHDESRWRPKSGRLSDLSYSSSPFCGALGWWAPLHRSIDYDG